MQFGDILTVRRFKSTEGFYTAEDYIYLTDVADTTYLASVLNKEEGKEALKLSDKNQKFKDRVQFYVVELSTESLKERIVLLNNPTNHGVTPKSENINEELNIEDKKKIKDEICGGEFAADLINAISRIELD